MKSLLNRSAYRPSSLFQSLGLEVDKYVASEVDEDAMKCSKRNHPEILQVGDVRSITEDNLSAWGPFDLMGKLECMLPSLWS